MISPIDGERYFLCMLLTVVRGQKSFTDLRTVDGMVFNTVKEACVALGLLADDSEWESTLAEAIFFKTGSTLRTLFATILQFDTIINSARLWDMFREHLCDDLKRRLQQEGIMEHPTQDDIYDYGLYFLDNILKDNDSLGKGLSKYREMPRLRCDWGSLLQYRILQGEAHYDPIKEQEPTTAAKVTLTDEQWRTFDKITAAVQSSTAGTNIFLTAT